MSLQEASISVWLQFSDDSASLLSSFSDLPFYLRLSSVAETVVVVMPSSSPRVFAQGDGGGPLLHAELLVSACADQPITSNSISEVGEDLTDSAAVGRGTRRLARGSGWIRVNLDLGFLQPVGDKKADEGFEFDISDTLVESDSDIYVSSFDDNDSGNVSSDYYDKISGKMPNRNWNEVGNRGMVSRNNLERAVLMPSQEGGAVYFSPSQEKGGERRELEVEKEGQRARELQFGIGAVLSLLCLFSVLFLANCLPCVLQDRRRTMREKKRDVELEGGVKTEMEERKKADTEDCAAEERETTEVQDRKTEERRKTDEEKTEQQQDDKNKVDMKDVEIVC